MLNQNINSVFIILKSGGRALNKNKLLLLIRSMLNTVSNASYEGLKFRVCQLQKKLQANISIQNSVYGFNKFLFCHVLQIIEINYYVNSFRKRNLKCSSPNDQRIIKSLNFQSANFLKFSEKVFTKKRLELYTNYVSIRILSIIQAI